MTIAFACQACGKRYSVKDELGGKRVKCAACGETMQLPEAGEAPSAAAAPQPPAAPVKEAKAPAAAKPAATAPASKQLGGNEPGEYELDSAPPKIPAPGTVPTMAGHILQPKIDPQQIDEFELEPPLKAVEIDLFLDADAPGEASPPTAKAKKGKPAAPVAKSSASTSEDLALAEDPKEAHKEPEPTVPCSSCGGALKPNSVFCIHCGLDMRTGEKVEGAPVKKGALGKLFGGLKRDK